MQQEINSKNNHREKIKTIEELARISSDERGRGNSVVLAHGTFDLLHLGHVRHLDSAAREGDILIVTVTDDKFVNKGPHRPVFTTALRLEMLAAMQSVDYVALNAALTADLAINAIKPDVYVKGSDYADASDDLTGKIIEEQQAVEAYGGKVIFTDDITFSSSALLNRHFDDSNPELKMYLDAMRERDMGPQLLDVLDSIQDKKVLLVGDTIVDEYTYVSPLGKSPKENLVSTLYNSNELFAGGVIAAANHVADFCKKIDILTCLGELEDHETLVSSSLHSNVELHAVHRPDVPTVKKTRFLDRDYTQKLFEVYSMDDRPLGEQAEAEMLTFLRDRAGDYDVVIATDFGHGMITPAIQKSLIENSKFLAVNAQSNSANHGFNLITKYPSADYICIDSPEARLAVSNKSIDLERIADTLLPERIKCGRLILTHGRYGCVTYDHTSGVARIPAFTRRVIDTMGAGDAFLAVTSPIVSTGCDMRMVGFIGNAVGAIKVSILGHRRSVDKVSLAKYLQTLLK